jgi:hypothetical protein
VDRRIPEALGKLHDQMLLTGHITIFLIVSIKTDTDEALL